MRLLGVEFINRKGEAWRFLALARCGEEIEAAFLPRNVHVEVFSPVRLGRDEVTADDVEEWQPDDDDGFGAVRIGGQWIPCWRSPACR